eukprot:TRINITY_DN17036_c0_g1_i2.p2 TRINITY_DN17036_c0_g1~~TRINITY_DN17036_c0_g1_i2.p2  ORF type:complete len:141 (-),score=37.15 TRINITY_DN17036_c0_g1_i2:283-705(-)
MLRQCPAHGDCHCRSDDSAEEARRGKVAAEPVQHNRILLSEKKDDHKKFSMCIKLGVHAEHTNHTKVAELLRCQTLESGDELKEHADHRKKGQNDIFYVTGEGVAVVSSSPLEPLRKKGYKVKYMVDSVYAKKPKEDSET